MDSDLSRSLRLLAGIQEKMAATPNTRIVPLHYNQTDTLTNLVERGSVEGVIGAFLGDRWLEHLLPHRIPLVNVGTVSEIHTVPSVMADFPAIGALTVRHFAETSWPHTAMIYERASHASREMHDGFMAESQRLGRVPFIMPEGLICADASRLGDWLTTLPANTGCFCSSDFVARQVLLALRAIGRPVPDDIGVIGVGDSLLDSALSPCTLSTVIPPDREIGLRAANMLAEMIAGKQTTHASERIPPSRIIVRESSAAARFDAPVVAKAVHYMSTHLFAPCGMETLAQHCGASKRSLEMRFKAATGQSPATEWKRRRHREICRLLAETTLPIKEIAALSGRAEASNFWNAFRKTEGITPAQYRTRHVR